MTKQELSGLLLTVIVSVHTLVAALHGLAHQQMGVSLSTFQFDYVVWVVVIAPITAIVLFWAGFRPVGLVLLLVSMAGSLVFGLYYHFWATGPDNTLMLPEVPGTSFFQATAVSLAVLEVLAYSLGLRLVFGTADNSRE